MKSIKTVYIFYQKLFNAISFSMLYHITKLLLTNIFLCMKTILTFHKGQYFTIHKGNYVNKLFMQYHLRKEVNVQNLFVHLMKVLIHLLKTLQDFFLNVSLSERYIRYSIQIRVQHDYLYV